MNRKLIVFSFDDGTIYDFRLIEILRRHNLTATFNLNSELKDYVWYNEGIAIKRFDLNQDKSLYDGFEVASHSKKHMYLTDLDEETLIDEVEGDANNLSNIFGYQVTSFAVPFDSVSEKIIQTIKKKTSIKAIRVPNYKEDFSLPTDSFHIGVNVYSCEIKSLDSLFTRFESFLSSDEPISLLVIAGHSYDFEIFKRWEYFEKFCYAVSCESKVEVITMRELARKYLDQ